MVPGIKTYKPFPFKCSAPDWRSFSDWAEAGLSNGDAVTATASPAPTRNTLRRVRIVGDLIMCISSFSSRLGISGVRHTDGIKREAEAIGRWCRRYVGISPRDERRS